MNELIYDFRQNYNLDALTNDQIIKAIEQITNPFSAWSDFDERSVLAQLLWNLLNEVSMFFSFRHFILSNWDLAILAFQYTDRMDVE